VTLLISLSYCEYVASSAITNIPLYYTSTSPARNRSSVQQDQEQESTENIILRHYLALLIIFMNYIVTPILNPNYLIEI
jgi:hypothetical protein